MFNGMLTWRERGRSGGKLMYGQGVSKERCGRMLSCSTDYAKTRHA